MKRAYVQKSDGRVRLVKNLGWLLRNWQNIESLEWAAPTVYIETPMPPEGEFRAYMCDGSTYVTPYASFEVWKGFINRPVFRGLPVVVNGFSGTV